MRATVWDCGRDYTLRPACASTFPFMLITSVPMQHGSDTADLVSVHYAASTSQR